LAVVGVALMAAAAVLGGILVHDGATAKSADLATAAPGQSVAIKGDPLPFTPAPPLRAWRTVLAILGDNKTYTLDSDGMQVLLTSPRAAPDGTVLAQGHVIYVAPHPDGSGRLLVVVGVHDWRSPILFR
jgi:hypothetical protein